MTEPDAAAPPPEIPDEPAPPPEHAAKRDRLPWLVGIGFLILAAAIAGVWLYPLSEPPVTALADARAQALVALEARLARLEQRPAPPATAPPATAPSVDLGPLTTRIAGLEQRRGPDLAPLEARVAALEARPTPDSHLAGRVDALSARADAQETAQRAAQSDLARRLDADETRLAAAERNAGQMSALADRAGRVARVQAAQAALNAGQKLGDLPGAPPALARFAAAPPPTEASLRLAFPAAAREALAAARPQSEGQPLLARLWAETQDLVTVRQGDHVLVGDPAAGVLARARAALDAGDLAGAAAAVGALTGPSAQAMAGWLADARSLLDARAALADWAAHA